MTQNTPPHSPEIPPSLKVLFSFICQSQPFQGFVSHQILEILSFQQGQRRLLISPISFLLPIALILLPLSTFPSHSHICGATAFKCFNTPTTPPACGWLDNIDLYTVRGFMDLLISRQFKVCLASYHMKTDLWAILHPTTVDGIFQVNIRTQHSILVHKPETWIFLFK